MKKQFLLICIGGVLGLSACNNAETSNAEPKDTAISLSNAIAPVVEDPDPTDTIPGDRYGIHSSGKSTADLVRLTLRDQYKADLENNAIDSLSRRFIFFEYDLNDDGKLEILVGLRGSYFCGSGGCTQYLLDNQGNVISKFTVAGYPVVIDNNKTNGWKNLFIESGGKNHMMKYDGKKYPSNPSMQPVLKEIPGDGLPRALNFVNEPYPWFSF